MINTTFLHASWPAPSNIIAGVSLRQQGCSSGPYSSFNLATHVGDNANIVAENRAALDHALPGVKKWQWLDQVHGVTVVEAPTGSIAVADASFTEENNVVCAVLTADCLPILLCDDQGKQVAAIHAGWRSLCGGVIENTVKQFSCHPHNVMVWLGPAIGPHAFEVGKDVVEAFQHQVCGEQSIRAFVAKGHDKYWADIYALANIRLAALGINQVFGGGLCTVNDDERFYSYRRDGITGRMASFIYKLP